MNPSLKVFKDARKALIDAGMCDTKVDSFLQNGQISLNVSGPAVGEALAKKFEKAGLQASVTHTEDYGLEYYSVWVRF